MRPRSLNDINAELTKHRRSLKSNIEIVEFMQKSKLDKNLIDEELKRIENRKEVIKALESLKEDLL